MSSVRPMQRTRGLVRRRRRPVPHSHMIAAAEAEQWRGTVAERV